MTFEAGNQPSADALIVATPLGLDATTAALEEGLDVTRVVAIDTLLPFEAAKRRTLMTTPPPAPPYVMLRMACSPAVACQ